MDFPAWMQQQLDASRAPVAPLTTPRLGGGQMPMPGLGGLLGGGGGGGPIMGVPLGGGLLGGAPQPNPGVSAGGLPTQGAATGFPGLGMPSTSGGGYEAMKADTLRQLTAGQRARVDAQRAQAPTLQQFASTFNSLPNDADKFVYWNSQPEKGMYDPFVNSLPGFRDWVNQMFNNYAGGSLAGAKWNPLTNSIRQ